MDQIFQHGLIHSTKSQIAIHRQPKNHKTNLSPKSTQILILKAHVHSSCPFRLSHLPPLDFAAYQEAAATHTLYHRALSHTPLDNLALAHGLDNTILAEAEAGTGVARGVEKTEVLAARAAGNTDPTLVDPPH